MPGRLARPLNTSRLYSSLIRPPLRLSHLHTFTRKRPSPTRTHTHTPHRTTSTRLLPTLLLTTTTMSTTSDTHHVEEQEEEELTRHLMGHPLPALINLPSTSSSNSSSSDTDPTSSSSPPSVEADLFMLSLTSPILVYCFSDNSPTTSTNTHQGLANFNAVVPLLKDKERQNQQRQQQQQQQDEEEGEQGTDLVVFGLTLDSVETCENLKHEHKLNNFDILSDSSKAFSSALELPLHTQKQKQGQSPQLKPLLLLFREGQVVRFESPRSDADVPTCAMKMLRTEQEVERDWTLLREQKQSQSQ